MKKAVIIGAGPAGLTAADELLRAGGYEITVLEATDEIGGISRTVRCGGCRMDIGGHRFFSKSPEVNERWKELMPLQGAPALDDRILGREPALSEGGPDPDSEDRVMLVRRRVSRIYYLKKFFDYPVSMKWKTFRNLGLARTVGAGFSYLKSAIFRRPENSLEDFYINRFGKVLYSMFFEGYTEKLWGRHPREISADWGAQRVRGLSVRAVLRDMLTKAFGKKTGKNTETSLIEEFWYPKYGPGQLWETLAGRLRAGGVKIETGCEAKKLICADGKVTSVVCLCGGKERTFEADAVFSSMPLRDLVAGIEGETPPRRVREIADGLPYRDFVTVGLLLDRLKLKNDTGIRTLGNIVPDCWIYVQDTGVRLGRIQIFNNWSPYMVEDPEHTVWAGLEYFCTEGDDLWNMSSDETARYASAELVKMGLIDEGDVLASHCERVKKAYPAYFGTYGQIDELTGYLDGLSNLYCIGRNGQHRYNNMDHSMMTAAAAVRCLEGKAEKKDIWNVNTEREYHEEAKAEK